MNKKAFLEHLTNDLTPQSPWRPWRLTLLWMSWALILNSSAMLLIQQFRPQFLSDLVTYPWWTLQIALGFAFGFVCCYWVLTLFIPGAKVSLRQKWTGWLIGAIFFASVFLSFHFSMPKHGLSGARSFCLEEVLLYGLLGILSFQVVTRKIDYNIAGWKYSLMGVASGLVPALLMHMACMYGPKHALIAHYGPILLLIPLAMLTTHLRKFFVK